jgi:hypothetical protein
LVSRVPVSLGNPHEGCWGEVEIYTPQKGWFGPERLPVGGREVSMLCFLLAAFTDTFLYLQKFLEVIAGHVDDEAPRCHKRNQ